MPKWPLGRLELALGTGLGESQRNPACGVYVCSFAGVCPNPTAERYLADLEAHMER